MIFLAFLIFTLLFVMAVTSQGFAFSWVFVNGPSLLFVLLGIAGYFLLFGRNEFGRGVKTFFAFSFPPDDHSPESGRFFLRLSEFTLTWGLFGMVFGLMLMLSDLDPDRMGTGLAIMLLSFLYAIGLALFMFLPIGLRLSPPQLDSVVFRRLLIRLSWFALVGFVFLRCLAVILVFSVAQLSTELPPYTYATALQHAAFALNPADPYGTTSTYSPFHRLSAIWLYIDPASLVLLVACWWTFRMASGKRRKWIAAPIVILFGLFWSVVCFPMMASNLNPQTFGAGYFVSMLTTLYGFLAAAGFLMADMVKSGDYGRVVPSSSEPSEGTEQAKEILDRAVEKERR